MTAQKAIEKSQEIIAKEIDRIRARIAGIREKYPEDVYGLKWREKADALEKEKEELLEYTELIGAARVAKAEAQRRNARERELFAALIEYRETLAQLDAREAERLRNRWRNI